MKKRILGIVVALTAVALILFSVISASVFYEASAEQAQSMWSVYFRSLPVILLIIVFEVLICLLITYFATDFILRPVEKLALSASHDERVQTDCAELQPIAKTINRMNGQVAQRICEIEEEKTLAMKAQQSKNDFIANITHEMNTPLTSIKGFAELLSSGALEGKQAEKAAQTVLTQSERLSNLIACIINYNEIDSEDLPSYEVNASKIAVDLLETLSPSFSERKIVLNSEICEDVLLTSRQERVTEIFGNLIRNAIRYNREGGQICVKLTKEEFCVSDTGIGIAQEDLPRVFDRFFTVDKSHGGKNGGFGLGLSVVKKLCEKAQWELSVSSILGEGTTFRILFHKNQQ